MLITSYSSHRSPFRTSNIRPTGSSSLLVLLNSLSKPTKHFKAHSLADSTPILFQWPPPVHSPAAQDHRGPQNRTRCSSRHWRCMIGTPPTAGTTWPVPSGSRWMRSRGSMSCLRRMSGTLSLAMCLSLMVTPSLAPGAEPEMRNRGRS